VFEATGCAVVDILYGGQVAQLRDAVTSRGAAASPPGYPCSEKARQGASGAEIHKLYRCHDRLLTYKQAVFDHLVGRWRDLFNVSFDVLLYDLTSTYFEADPPFPEGDKRRYGYSRDHRPDCVQIVIALVVTPEGLPLAYEVLPGNTSDKTTFAGVSGAHRETIRESASRMADADEVSR
jgi:hypothetical protein